MGIGEKMSNKAKEAVGKVKEGVGEATNNERLQAAGAKDQTVAKTKQAAEHLNDAAKEAKHR